MRDEPVQIVLIDIICRQGFFGDRTQCSDGTFKNSIAVHMDKCFFMPHGIVTRGNPGRHVQQLLVLTIGMHVCRNNALLFAGR